MAYEIPGYKLGTRVAGSDLSAKQFLFVKVAASNTVAVSGAGELSLGVLQNKPVSGEAAEIMVSGVTKVWSSAAVLEGAVVTPDSAGKAVTATTGNEGHGIALAAASGADELIPILLVNLGIRA